MALGTTGPRLVPAQPSTYLYKYRAKVSASSSKVQTATEGGGASPLVRTRESGTVSGKTWYRQATITISDHHACTCPWARWRGGVLRKERRTPPFLSPPPSLSQLYLAWIRDTGKGVRGEKRGERGEGRSFIVTTQPTTSDIHLPFRSRRWCHRASSLRERVRSVLSCRPRVPPWPCTVQVQVSDSDAHHLQADTRYKTGSRCGMRWHVDVSFLPTASPKGPRPKVRPAVNPLLASA